MVKRTIDADYGALSKSCAGCGHLFHIRDRAHQSYRRFAARSYCSAACKPDKFWDRVAISGPLECWEWQGARNAKGYGKVSRFGKDTGAHRVAFELSRAQEIPVGLVVRHRCDNPPCCNPAHLELGTHAENWQDSVERGRTRALDRTNPAVFVGSQSQAAKAVGFSKSAVKRARAAQAAERGE